jgi:uncharacterized protein (TIGR00266 family)
MNIDIQYRPAHSLAVVSLQPGEEIRAEANAMVSMSSNIAVKTDGPMGRKQGGLLKGLKRAFLSGESFFTNQYIAQGGVGEVALAPNLCGDMVVHSLTQGESLFIQGSSYVAAPDTVQIDTKFQGFWRGALGGENFFFLHATGHGPVLINAFGAIDKIDLDGGEVVVDTGHLVAYTGQIEYSIGKAAKSLIASWLSGEGLVLRMRGRGRIYLQTRNPNEYGTAVGRRLPPRQK